MCPPIKHGPLHINPYTTTYEGLKLSIIAALSLGLLSFDRTYEGLKLICPDGAIGWPHRWGDWRLLDAAGFYEPFSEWDYPHWVQRALEYIQARAREGVLTVPMRV